MPLAYHHEGAAPSRKSVMGATSSRDSLLRKQQRPQEPLCGPNRDSQIDISAPYF